MKFNFDKNKIIRFLSNHKYVVFVVVFVAFIFLFRTRTVIEGLTSVGEYDYLAPVGPNNKISDEIMKTYVEKYNANADSMHTPKMNVTTPENLAIFKKQLEPLVKEKELQYYIDNGKYPYDSYVLNALNAPDVLSVVSKRYNLKDFTPLEQLQMSVFNRIAYQQFLQNKESQMSPPPLSYQIYMGTSQPPSMGSSSGSSPGSSSGSSSRSSSRSSSGSSFGSSSQPTDSNYQDFISLCKKALNQ